jgi:two-component system phosphate regulon sensor histidine kinase PhoR
MLTLMTDAAMTHFVAFGNPPSPASGPPAPMGAATVGLMLVAVVAIGIALFLYGRGRRRAEAITMLAAHVRNLRRGSEPTGIPGDFPPDCRAIAGDVEAMRSDFLARLEDASREREWLISVLSRMPDGVVVTDQRGIVVLVNGALLHRVRMTESRAVGHLFIEVVQDHEANEVVRRCLSTGAEQRAVVETEPGRTYLNVTATPLGRHGGCVVVLQDVTEVRRLENVRRDFVANVSHELRTPLASLKLLAETIASGSADEPVVQRDYMQRIEVEVDRLAQMVDELGELSLIETGQVSLDKRPVNIEALIVRAVERLEAQAVRAGIGLLLTVPQDLPEPVADERRLEQVLVNLLHNAIKFTPSGGRVSVAASADDENVTVSVSDTGVGIAEEDLPRIFERFYKADKSRSSRGTGLGLAIARHVIQAHGGRIWAESREGAGSVFSFSLPLGRPAV